METGTWSSPWCAKSQGRVSHLVQLINTYLPNISSVLLPVLSGGDVEMDKPFLPPYWGFGKVNNLTLCD